MKKTKIFLNDAEWQLVIHSLNALRNKLIQAGQFTDVVDDALLKVINAPVKMVKII